MLDLLVKNGFVVTPHGSGYWDVGIADGIIVSINAPGSGPADAARVVDATGKIIVPGGIDPHIHSKWHIPSDNGPGDYTAGIEQVSRAALYGGTTTLIDFAVWQPGESLAQTVERREKDFAGQSFTDYCYHMMLSGEVAPELVEQIPELVQAGHASVKIFTTNIRPNTTGRKIGFGDIYEILKTLAKAGGIAAIHAEDDDIVMHSYKKLTDAGKSHFTHMAEAHNTLSEDLAFRRIIRLAEHIEGAALYMMHVSAKTGVDAIAESRAKGFPIYGETLHQYVMFSAEAYFKPNGQIYHTYPSLKFNEDRRALWAAMKNGTIGTVATDELCTLLELKTRTDKIWDVTGGNSGVEPRMGVMFTEAVKNRGFSLEQFVNITSANAARLMGLYPRKGAVAVGSDADLCVMDPNARFVLATGDLHETDYSPWEGWPIEGWPTTTILRGKIVVDDRKFVADAPNGKWVTRKLSEQIGFGL